MKSDPDFYDTKVAGRWCHGACCWIGSGWCVEQIPRLSTADGQGVNKGLSEQLPVLDTYEGGGMGKGVNAKVPCEDWQGRGYGMENKGVNARGHRPQLADAYSRGRGVHNDNHLHEKMPHVGDYGRGVQHVVNGTCAERRAWLVNWFQSLRDRLRTVRVCCGDWKRVCGSESVTTRLGVTGVFFDPPYSSETGRTMSLYSQDCGKIAHSVREYCIERGSNQEMRIVLAGYEGEHNELEKHGWGKVAWEAGGGYANRGQKKKENAKLERLWYSPHCVSADMPLFVEGDDAVATENVGALDGAERASD
jgi:hypothetical protein